MYRNSFSVRGLHNHWLFPCVSDGSAFPTSPANRTGFRSRGHEGNLCRQRHETKLIIYLCSSVTKTVVFSQYSNYHCKHV